MHHILCFIVGIAQCHRTRRTMALSFRRVSSPRHVPSPRRVLFGPPCAFCLILSVFRNLHFGIDIALNLIETLIIKPGTFGYNFGIAVHCTANRLGPLRYLALGLFAISPWTLSRRGPRFSISPLLQLAQVISSSPPLSARQCQINVSSKPWLKKIYLGWALSDPVPESNRIRKASPVGMPAGYKP